MPRALRSPGSTLKPLVYGLAFDAGLAHPETLIDDRPTAYGTYAPQNFDGEFRGTVKVRDALQLSPGAAVEFAVNAGGEVVLRPAAPRRKARKDRFEAVRGKADIHWRTDDLMKLLRSED